MAEALPARASDAANASSRSLIFSPVWVREGTAARRGPRATSGDPERAHRRAVPRQRPCLRTENARVGEDRRQPSSPCREGDSMRSGLAGFAAAWVILIASSPPLCKVTTAGGDL